MDELANLTVELAEALCLLEGSREVALQMSICSICLFVLQPGMPVQGPCYCKPCDQWLNGAGQYLDHAAGGTHLRKVRQAQRAVQHAAVPAQDVVASEAP